MSKDRDYRRPPAPKPVTPGLWRDLKTDAERKAWFMEQVEPEPNTGCWLWTGRARNTGYGIVYVGITGRRDEVFAHRMALTLFAGRALARDEHVCHKCNTPSCVNPGHLEVGDAKTNLRYCTASGRAGQAKLTVADVVEIRSEWSRRQPAFFRRGVFYKEMSDRYGVTSHAIANCIRGETWRNVAA